MLHDILGEEFRKKPGTDSLYQFAENLENYLIEQVDNSKEKLYLNEKGEGILKRYKEMMKKHVYGSNQIIISDNRAEEIITKVFHYCIKEKPIIDRLRNGEKKVYHRVYRGIYENLWLMGLDWPRIVANYIGCMTDRYLDSVYKQLFR